MNTFTIQRINAQRSNTIGSHERFEVNVVVTMPAKDWTKIRDKGFLGQLYGIDISNAVYAINRNIPAHNPTVDSRHRAVKGIKTIYLTYYGENLDAAERLGLEVTRFKNGYKMLAYSTYAEIKVIPQLTLIYGGAA